MEAGALLLLLITTFDAALTQTFYGQSVSFKHPKRNSDGTFEVSSFSQSPSDSTVRIVFLNVTQGMKVKCFLQFQFDIVEMVGMMGKGVFLRFLRFLLLFSMCLVENIGSI